MTKLTETELRALEARCRAAFDRLSDHPATKALFPETFTTVGEGTAHYLFDGWLSCLIVAHDGVFIDAADLNADEAQLAIDSPAYRRFPTLEAWADAMIADAQADYA